MKPIQEYKIGNFIDSSSLMRYLYVSTMGFDDAVYLHELCRVVLREGYVNRFGSRVKFKSPCESDFYVDRYDLLTLDERVLFDTAEEEIIDAVWKMG